jgi:hypothetical protein
MTSQEIRAEYQHLVCTTEVDPGLPGSPKPPGPGPKPPPPAPDPPLPQPPGQQPEGPQPIEEPPAIPPEVPHPIGDPRPDMPEPQGPGRRNPPLQVGSRISRFLGCRDRHQRRIQVMTG